MLNQLTYDISILRWTGANGLMPHASKANKIKPINCISRFSPKDTITVRNKVLERERERESETEIEMKYLEVEKARRPEAKGWCCRQHVEARKTDLRSDVFCHFGARV